MKKILLLLCLFGRFSNAFASFPFFEPFADANGSGGYVYTNGTLLAGKINATGDRWYGAGTTQTAGNAALLTNVSLSYSGLPASSGGAYRTKAGSGPGGRMFISTSTAGFVTNQDVTFYYSFVIKLEDITALSATGEYWIGFNNQGTIADQTGQPGVQAARLYFRKLSGSDYQIGIAKNAANISWDPATRTTNDVLFVVGANQMISAGGAVTDDNALLWVNPSSATFGTTTPPTETASIVGTDPDINFISSFVILDRTASTATSAMVDEVRVGKTWMFVTGGPEFAVSPVSTTNVIAPNTFTLSALAKSGNSSAVSYQWKKDGANLVNDSRISGATSSNLIVTTTVTNDAGIYSVIVSNSVGAATNFTTVAILESDPNIQTQPSSRTNVVGTTATFTVVPGGTAPFSYQWYRNSQPLADGGNISGATSATLTISSVSNVDVDNYYVVVTGFTANQITSVTVTLTVQNAVAGPPLYWDTNGSTSGGEGLSTNWNDRKWSTDANGSILTGAWLDNSLAVFSAGTDVTIPFTVTVSGTQTLTGITIQEGSPTINGGTLLFANPSGTAEMNVAADSAAIIGTTVVAGTNTLVKSGQGSMRFNGVNTYSGQTLVNAGILRAGNTSAFGTGVGNTVIASGATLDIFGRSLVSEPISAQGAGVGGTNGAIDNTGASQTQAFRDVTLTGDTTFNASGARWDAGASGGSFIGNGFTLTKIGSQPTFIKDVGETGIGDIHVIAGRLGFQASVTMGDPTKIATVESNAILTLFYASSAPESFIKQLVLNSGSTLDTGGASNNFLGTITLSGTSTIATRTDLTLRGAIVGTGGFIHTINSPVGSGNGVLYSEGTNTYTGPTIIRANSHLVVGANSSLGTSSLVQLEDGSSLDVSALSSFNFSATRILTGTGTVLGNNTIFGSGSTLAPGYSNSVGVLTVNGNLNLQNGSTNFFKVSATDNSADQVVGITSVNFGGILVLSNISGTFAAGNTFTLFQSSGYGGVFNSIIPATPGNGLSWNTNNLGINGQISVEGGAHFTGISRLNNGTVELTFTGSIGQQYTLLASTNVALPIANWTAVATGTIESSPFTISDLTATNFSTRFYTMSLQ